MAKCGKVSAPKNKHKHKKSKWKQTVTAKAHWQKRKEDQIELVVGIKKRVSRREGRKKLEWVVKF